MADPVVCFGELLIRLSTPDARLISQADSLSLSVGGAEGNVAAALASLGYDARFLSIVSDNSLGERAIAALRAPGVDTRFVARGPGRMGLYFLEVGAGSRPSAITYDRMGSVFAMAEPSAVAFEAALSGARLLHSGGITPALGPPGVALAHAAHDAARRLGVPICFDGNYRAQLWEAWDSEPAAILRDLVADATILIGNHRDIALLLNRPFAGDGPERRREAAEAAFAAFGSLELIASTARHVVDAGHHRLAARVDMRTRWHQSDEIEIKGIVERVGTGDAFAAGVLHAWLNGSDPQQMVETGLALAALKHTIPGDMTLVSREMLAGFSHRAGDVRR